MQGFSTSLDSPRLDRQPLTSARYLPLHFVITGRNAWWRTWIQRYSDGALHLSLGGAKAYSEARRVQGTRFAIEQIPALVFTGEHHVLAVTQINTTEPLKHFDRTRLDELGSMLRLRSLTLGQLVQVFARNSNFWTVPPASNDSLLVTAAEADTALPARDDAVSLTSWTSSSFGPRYRLNWASEKSDINTDHVVALARHWTKA